jgi:hypothetical protein
MTTTDWDIEQAGMFVCRWITVRCGCGHWSATVKDLTWIEADIEELIAQHRRETGCLRRLQPPQEGWLALCARCSFEDEGFTTEEDARRAAEEHVASEEHLTTEPSPSRNDVRRVARGR